MAFINFNCIMNCVWVVTQVLALIVFGFLGGDRSDRSWPPVRPVYPSRATQCHEVGPHSAMQTGLTGRLHRSDRLVQTEPFITRSNVLFSAPSFMIRILVDVMIIFM